MSALFKSVIFLALALSAGFYVWSVEPEIFQSLSHEVLARAPVDASAAEAVNEELDYLVAKRNGSLEGWQAFLAAHKSGSHARLATAEVETLLLAEKATSRAALEVSKGAAPDAKTRSEAASEALRRATEVPSSNEICKRDADRLDRLIDNPSSEEAQRLATELNCEALRPELLGLMQSLGYAAPAPVAAGAPNGATPAASPTSEAPSPPLQGTKVASLTSDEICQRDLDRFERLLTNPSSQESQRFASELGCEALRPELERLMKSYGYAAPAPASSEVSTAATPEAKVASEAARPAPSSSKKSIAAPQATASLPRKEASTTAATVSDRDQVSAPNSLSRSPELPVVETQTQAPVAAAKSIAAPPSGRVAILSSAGSIDSVSATALASPGASAPGTVGDLSPQQSDGAEPTIQGVSDKEILFGMAAPFSGASRELGRQMKIGVETAFSQINSAGGVNGRLLRLVAADDGYEPEKTADAMHLLYDKEKVFGFIGNVGTPTAAVALPFALDHRALFFGAFTGASLLRRDPPDRYVFNYRASYAEETNAVVRYLVRVRRIQLSEIVVFAQQDAFGDSGYAGVQKAARSLPGNNPDIVRLNYKRNTVDVQDAVNALRAFKGKIKAVVMVASYRAAAKFIEKTRDLYPPMIFTNVSFVGSTALADELILLGPRYAVGVVVTQVVPAINSYASIVLRYKETLAKYFPGEAPDYVSFEGYIDASILAEAVKRAGRDINTEKIVDQLEQMNVFDLGLGAPVTFSANEHQGSHKVWGTQLDDAGTINRSIWSRPRDDCGELLCARY